MIDGLRRISDQAIDDRRIGLLTPSICLGLRYSCDSPRTIAAHDADAKLLRAVKIPCEKRIRQLTEELLEQPCDAVHVVLESFRISKVHL
jgi:hypothetical protein